MPKISNEVATLFTVSGQSDASFDRFTTKIEGLDDVMSGFGKNSNKVSKAAELQGKAIAKLEKSIGRLNFAVKAFLTFEISRALSRAVGGTLDFIRETERLEAQLFSLEGTAEGAAQKLNELQNLSLTLPSQGANSLVEAYAKLENLNLDSSEQSLREFTDLASGLGRQLPRLIEALADASTFEFERLKEEFGIVARSVGDTIRISFRGQTQTIERSGEAITEYLRGIATSRFAGAAERTLNTVGGQFDLTLKLLQLRLRQIDEESKVIDKVTTLLTKFNALLDGYFEKLDPLAKAEEALSKTRVDLATATEKLAIAQFNLSQTPEALQFFQGNEIFNLQRNVDELTRAFEKQSAEVAQFTAGRESAEEAAIGAIQKAINAEKGRIDTIEKLTGSYRKEKDVLDLIIESIDRLRAIEGAGTSQAVLGEITTLQLFAREVKNAREAIANEKFIKDVEAAAKRLFGAIGTEAEKAAASFKSDLGVLDKYGKQIALKLGLSEGELESRLKKNFEEALINSIGEPVVRGITKRSIAAVNEQSVLLRQAVAESSDAIAQQFSDREVELVSFRLDEALIAAKGKANELTAFENDFLSKRAEFLQGNGNQNNELTKQFNEFAAIIRGAFVDDFSIDIDSVSTFADKLALISQEVARLEDLGFSGLSIGKVIGNTFADANLEKLNLEELRSQLQRVAEGSEGEGALRLEIAERYNERILRANGDLYDRIRDNRLTDLDSEKTSLRDRFAVTAQLASDILGIWTDNSKGVFKVSKALDIAILANEASVAIGNAISQFSTNPLNIFGGIVQVGALVAKYAKLINDVTGREFGDGTVRGGGGNSIVAAGAVPPGGGAQQGNNTINIYGSVLDTDRALRRTLVDSLKEAGARDEISVDDFVERRA